MTQTFDIAVIGAGIAGASVAARLAQAGKTVALLEMESQAGYHTTGRSAAIFAPSYGPPIIRALARASHAFFIAPPTGFCDAPLFSPRQIMMLARDDQSDALTALKAEVGSETSTQILDEAGLRTLNPLVREGYASAALLDTAGQDIDVNALHQGFLRQFKQSGGTVLLNAEVHALDRTSSGWLVESKSGNISAEIVVNAAGAWADQIARLAQAEVIGLIPKRRSAAMIAAPNGLDTSTLPMTIDIDEQFYLKPDAGRFLISPADETPSAPCDAQPEDIDIAICVDRIETAFDLSVRRIESKWAGLRSFVPDHVPVSGFSQIADRFYWLAGQGGYGIQTAPALSDFAAAQILGATQPDALIKGNIEPSALGIGRLLS